QQLKGKKKLLSSYKKETKSNRNQTGGFRFKASWSGFTVQEFFYLSRVLIYETLSRCCRVQLPGEAGHWCQKQRNCEVTPMQMIRSFRLMNSESEV
ncbi:Hypothetical predicted protein, partial [Pelobates cultripes]